MRLPPALPFVLSTLLLSSLLSACGDDSATDVGLGTPTLSFTAPGKTIEIANYRQTGYFNLPVPASSEAGNELALEVSAIAYDKDRDSLFVMGDEGTGIVQVSKTGTQLDTMALSGFEDTEGLTYIGGGQFVLVEERLRQVSRFTYLGSGTLTAGSAEVKTVKLGTTVGNIGMEGIGFDPQTGGYIGVKEASPQGIFQTGIDFTALTATNGSETTENPINLFDPALSGLSVFSDVFALSNVVSATAGDAGELLIVSGPAGKVAQLSRAGVVIGVLDVGIAPQNEGLVMDADRKLYVTGENAGGPGVPGMAIYEPTSATSSVGIGSNVYLGFNRNVVAGTGNLTLTGGADVRNIAIGDTSQVSISGSSLRIDPSEDLIPGVAYSVTFPAGLLRDDAGNSSPAVSDTTTLRFTTHGTADSTAPTLVGSVPADNATNVSGSQILLNFSEAMRAGIGNIVLSSEGDTRTIPVGEAQVVISDSTVTITPTTPLAADAAYSVQIAPGVLRDRSFNNFAGINDTTSLNFTVAPTPTVLQAGDVLFMGGNTDAPDSYAFVLLKDVTAGTRIGFTDKDYNSANTPPFPGNEAAVMWTADTGYPAGTIITVQTEPSGSSNPGVDRGTITGNTGGLSTSAETVYAFQGNIEAGLPVVERFLAAMSFGTAAGEIPAELTAADAVLSFTLDNNLYVGSMDRSDIAVFAARIRDTANYSGSDDVSFPLTGASLYPQPTDPTVLQAGDVLFMAINADATDAFAFVLLKDISAGTQIGFTDKDYNSAADPKFPTNEAAYLWTADQAYPAGTIVTIQPDNEPPVADKGSTAGKGGGLSTSAETVYAFQGSTDGTAVTVDHFLAAINASGGAAGEIPAELTAAGSYISFATDNARYSGSLDRSDLNAFATSVRNSANYDGSDSTAFPLSDGSLFP
jgi:uncharacterized protein YjiK